MVYSNSYSLLPVLFSSSSYIIPIPISYHFLILFFSPSPSLITTPSPQCCILLLSIVVFLMYCTNTFYLKKVREFTLQVLSALPKRTQDISLSGRSGYTIRSFQSTHRQKKLKKGKHTEPQSIRQSAQLFLQSSELGLSYPLTCRRVCIPPP